MMEGKSLDDQEKEINDALRKAIRTPAKSAQRKDVLRRLIDLAHSPHPKLKITVAQNLKVFIKDFPDLEDDAINAVYDLCEDQVTKVRICGYRAIADVSKEQPKWVKRNADVLVQLLQSDEPDEVSVVKRMLAEHLDMDPAVTLGVLCDQIVPPEEPMDEEEQAIRTRLRSLVLSFMTGEARRAVERHTSMPGSAAEETLVAGFLRAVDKLTPADIDVIVKDVLLSLPSFKPSSPRGKQLLDVVLDKASASLKTDLSTTMEKRVAHPSHLLRFYYTSLVSRAGMLTVNAQAMTLSTIADTLAACEATPLEGASMSPQEYASLRKQTPDTCVLLLRLFSEATFSADQRPWRACQVFLKSCLRHHNEYKWSVSSQLEPILQNIQNLLCTQGQDAKLDNLQDIQNLIRSLQSASRPTLQPPIASATTDVSQGISSSSSTNAPKNERRIMNVKRKREDRPGNPQPLPTTAAPAVISNGASSTASTSWADRQRTSTPQVHRQRASTATSSVGPPNGQQGAPLVDEPRAPKRAKKGGGVEESPSLLSRLASAPSNGSANTRQAAEPTPSGKRRVESASTSATQSRQGEQDPDKDPVVGFSIKGAAKAVSACTPAWDTRTSKTSLLARMQGDAEMGGQRKKKGNKTS